MTISKFRYIELLVFTAISILIDFLIGRYGLFGLRMFFAISYPVIFLMYIRWRKWGLTINALVVIAHAIIYIDNPPLVILAHCLSILILGLMVFIEPKIRNKTFKYETISLIFIGLYLVMIMVEWLLLLIFGQDISLWGHLINQSVNLFIALLVLFIMHLQTDLVTDMETYFIQKNKGQ